MARIRLYSHAPSDTIGRLKEALAAAGHNVKKIKTSGSTYSGAAGDIIFNYGSSQLSAQTIGRGTVLNAPAAIGQSSNKRTAFTLLERGGVRTVDYTTTRSVAEAWVSEGALVYARTQLQGHSGEGIELIHQNPAGVGDAGGFPVHDHVINAPLYTKGILGNRREYRVHVFKGRILHVAQKRRRDGFADIEGNSNLVRNHHTGWVYSTQNMTALNHAGQCEALKSIAALGLDFGAVDIITNRESAWVLEVNTAPGMEGVTLEKYTQAITALIEGREVGILVDGYSDFRQQVQTENANNTQRTTRAVPPAPSAPAAQPQSRAEAAPTENTSRTETRSNRNTGTPVNNGYYWLTVNGEETIGQYNSALRHFSVIGWEVPIESADATVGARITR